MKDTYDKMGIFSKKIFNKSDSVGHILKLKEEADEVINEPTDIIEYADCFLCLFAAAYKAGFSYEDITKACEDKFKILKDRKWEISNSGLYQHIK